MMRQGRAPGNAEPSDHQGNRVKPSALAATLSARGRGRCGGPVLAALLTLVARRVLLPVAALQPAAARG